MWLVTDKSFGAEASTANKNRNHNPFLVVTYSKGLSESFRNICGKEGVQVYFKGANTVKEHLVTPKDKDNII